MECNIICQRMQVLRSAVKMHGDEGYPKVLEAYDAMWSRIVTGENSSLKSNSHADELVQRYIAECLDMDGGNKVQSRDLYNHFSDWCTENNEKVLTVRKFGLVLCTHFERIKSNKVWYVGIAFKPQAKAA